MILLADAMVLMDMEYVDGLDLLPRIATTEVLDLVLQECIHPSQPAIELRIKTAGISAIDTQVSWLREAMTYKTETLSTPDSVNLYYAKTFGRLLLTNEKPLREACFHTGVLVHGTLWLIEQAFVRELVPSSELCRWLKVLPQHRRRLPAMELQRLSNLLGC